MFYCQTIGSEIVKLKYYFPPKTITVTSSDVSGSENCQSQNKEVENSHGDGRKSTKKKGTPHGEDGNSTDGVTRSTRDQDDCAGTGDDKFIQVFVALFLQIIVFCIYH